MSSFRVLPGLPAYGPPAESFSSTGQGMHREGLVVEFTPSDGAAWVGNFQRGLMRFDQVFREPGSSRLVVVAGGEAYVVDPDARRCVRTFGGQIEQVMALEDGSLVFSNGLWLEALGASGRKWQTRRISWDGFRALKLVGARITGEAWTAPDEAWVPFAVSLDTGDVEGGAYPPELPQP